MWGMLHIRVDMWIHFLAQAVACPRPAAKPVGATVAHNQLDSLASNTLGSVMSSDDDDG
jgi:hypothetical protein